jgi:hypothetical protein
LEHERAKKSWAWCRRQEDLMFKYSLDSIVNSCLNKLKKKRSQDSGLKLKVHVKGLLVSGDS